MTHHHPKQQQTAKLVEDLDPFRGAKLQLADSPTDLSPTDRGESLQIPAHADPSLMQK
jgi:hypothetical protein